MLNRLTGAVVAITCLLAACAGTGPSGTQPTAGSEAAKQAAFTECESTGVVALTMARQYLVIKKGDKSAVLGWLGPNDAEARQIADELFDGVQKRQIRHHADFAADKLMACAKRNQLGVNRTRDQVRGCYARVDVPFFLQGFKDGGMPQAAAAAKVRGMFKDKGVYPDAFVNATAAEVYAAPASQSADRYQKAVFWQCLYGNKS